LIHLTTHEWMPSIVASPTLLRVSSIFSECIPDHLAVMNG
jgi:hypothetical protein